MRRHIRSLSLRAGVLLSAMLLSVAGLAAGVVAEETAAEEAVVPPGKAAFLTHKCNLCHAVPAAELEAKTKSDKMKGGDLGGLIETDFEVIAAYVRKQGELDGKSHKKEFKGTDEELHSILDWLAELEPGEGASED